MFQKAKEKGHEEFTFLSAMTSSASSIGQDALLAYPKCPQCNYYHSPGNCLANGRSAIDAVATTTSLPYAKEDCIDHPMVVEPST